MLHPTLALCALLASPPFPQDDGPVTESLPETVVEVLERLDAMAEQMAEQLSEREDREAHVCAVLNRQHAAQLGADPTQAYTVSTYRFRQRNRDDRQLCLNDWNLCLTGRKQSVDVCMVADDLCRLWDLGEQPFPTQLDLQPQAPLDREDFVPVIGGVHLLHAADEDEDAWFLLQPLAQQDGEWLILRWEALDEEQTAAARIVDQRPEQLLQDGHITLRVLTGPTGNPHRVHAHGMANAYVNHVFVHPDLGEEVELRPNDSAAWVRGGFIPAGKALVVEKVQVSASGRRPANNPARLVGVLGGCEWLVTVGLDTVTETWNGRAVLLPGDEQRLYLEASSYDTAEMVVEGELVDLAVVKRKKLDRLDARERRQIDQHLIALERAFGDEADLHIDAILGIGPRARAHLLAIPEDARTGNAGTQVEGLLERLSRGYDTGE